MTFTPIAIGFVVASRLGPRMFRWLDLRALLLGGALTTAGLVGALITVATESTWLTWTLPASLLLFGLGNGTTLPIVTGAVLRYLPPEQSGAGGAVLTTAQQVFGAIGVGLCGALLFSGGNLDSRGSVHPYLLPLGIQILAAVLTMACAVWLGRVVTRPDRSEF